MLKHTLIALALVTGCDKGASNETLRNGPGLAAAATVTLTSVAFADDCGGTPPTTPPPAPAQPAKVAPSTPAAPSSERAMPSDSVEPMGKRRCEQTSMQLAVNATKDVDVAVKKVEVFDDKGTSVGVLTPSSPTRWVDAQSAYQAWDGKVAAGESAQVSYVLSQPSFTNAYEERDRTYTVKVIASVGGVDQPLQTTVMVVGRPPAVPT